MALRNGERQVAPSLDQIRRDHTARYEWAARILPPGSWVIDIACGVGYGAKILADAGHTVIAIDVSQDAIDYGQQHYAHDRITWVCDDANSDTELPQFADAAICFETIEHLENPGILLRKLAAATQTLLASVPNQSKFPWTGQRFHFRHYTKQQFADLLDTSGFAAEEWYGQAGSESEVAASVNGRTRIVVAKRFKKTGSRGAEVKAAAEYVPDSVAIIGLGPSFNSTVGSFVGVTKRLGSRSRLADEIWGLNAINDIIRCDRGFHMDDVRIQQIRADAEPAGNIAAMLPWLKTHPGPIFTSRAHPDYPGLIQYPLAEVLNACGNQRYFNNTAAYAVAYAIYLGVKRIMCFGCDFSYPDIHHAEKGRACVEFWLGFATARGIGLSFPKGSSLMDANVPPAERFYGYDTVKLEISGEDGAETVTMTPRDELPTAEEMEARYDHSKHPNPLAGQS